MHWDIDTVICSGIMFALGWLAVFVLFDHHTSLGMYVGLCLGIVHFFHLHQQQKLSWALALPLLPVAAISLTTVVTMIQGGGNGDFRYAWMWLAVIVTGMAAGSLFPKKAWMPLVLLPLVLSGTAIWFFLHGDMHLHGRVGLPFRGVNEVGLLAGFSAVIYLGNIRDMGPRSRIALLIPGFIIPLAILLLTGSRTPAMALAASALSLFFFSTHKKRIFIFFILAGLALSFVCIKMPTALQHRINPKVIEQSFLTRMSIYYVSFRGFLEKPLLGHQKSHFQSYYKKYVKKHYTELKKTYKRVGKFMAHPHNIYIGIFFCWGVFGMASFILATYGAFVAALRENYLFPLMALVFFAFSGLSEFYIYRKDGLFIFFIVYGLAVGRHWGPAFHTKRGDSLISHPLFYARPPSKQTQRHQSTAASPSFLAFLIKFRKNTPKIPRKTPHTA